MQEARLAQETRGKSAGWRRKRRGSWGWRRVEEGRVGERREKKEERRGEEGRNERDLTIFKLAGKPQKEEKKTDKRFSVSEEGPGYGSSGWDLPCTAVQGSMFLKDILIPGCRESRGEKRSVLECLQSLCFTLPSPLSHFLLCFFLHAFPFKM